MFRHWVHKISVPTLVPEYKVETLYSGTDTVPEFWRGYLKKGVFTLVPSENRTRVPCSGTKCERGLKHWSSRIVYHVRDFVMGSWDLKREC